MAASHDSSPSTGQDVTDPDTQVRRIDFADPGDLQAYLDQLDSYARDPMGAGRPLQPEVRERLATDLPRHPTVMGLIAAHGDRNVGFATCFLAYSTFQARPIMNIHDIAVDPARRGQGVAQALLSAIEIQAVELGCCRISLEVRADNARARRLYDRRGFVPGSCELFLEKSLA